MRLMLNYDKKKYFDKYFFFCLLVFKMIDNKSYKKDKE